MACKQLVGGKGARWHAVGGKAREGRGLASAKPQVTYEEMTN